jgi:dihydroorotate dehydrogenase (NAD+) catalytic subunit
MNLSVSLAGLTLPSPVLLASGTCGNGEELADFMDMRRLGGIILKGTTLLPQEGNKPQRIIETPAGILNSIGLQNPGIDVTLSEKTRFAASLGIPCIINISGHSCDEYAEMAARTDACVSADAIEMNVSCPNVDKGGMAFGTDARVLFDAVSATRRCTSKPLIVKLSPNVTDIKEMARAAVDAGADALSLINTLVGMVIDTQKRRPVLARSIGGLSGPAVRPVALRMVWDVCHSVDVPVIGIGGITTTDDALQFLIAGAVAVQIGTASFFHPSAAIDILKGIEDYCNDNNFNAYTDMRIE